MFKSKIEENGRYYGYGEDLTPEEKQEREQLLNEKPEYILKIRTNFPYVTAARNMIAFSLGILDDSVMYECRNASKSSCSRQDWKIFKELKKELDKNLGRYWKREGCRSYEEYLQKTIEEGVPDRYKEFYGMLQHTWQCVGNYEQNTFYNVEEHEDGEFSILIQFKTSRFMETKEGKRFIKRIRKFFQFDKTNDSFLLSMRLYGRDGKVLTIK